MAFVGAFDAKTHLAELLDRVSRGEKITITRHGVPAAMLVPVGETSARMTHKEIVEGMRKLRKRIKPGKMNVRQTGGRGAAVLTGIVIDASVAARLVLSR